MKRRTFLLSTIAMLAIPTITLAKPSKQLDMWEAKIDTILQMAVDYQFTPTQTYGLFGYTENNTWSRRELRHNLLSLAARNSRDRQDRVRDILTVHTWLRGKCGSCLSAQEYELNKPQVGLFIPQTIAGNSLGELLRTGDYFNIRYAAEFCRTNSRSI